MSTTTEETMAALQADVAALKQDLTSLLAHLKTGASNGAQQAAGQIDQQAQLAYRKLSDQGQRSVKAVSNQIEEQPLLALLVVLGISYAGCRLLSR